MVGNCQYWLAGCKFGGVSETLVNGVVLRAEHNLIAYILKKCLGCCKLQHFCRKCAKCVKTRISLEFMHGRLPNFMGMSWEQLWSCWQGSSVQKIWICSKFAAYLLHMSSNFVANLFFHVFFCKKLRIFYLKQLILDKECSCASFAKKKKLLQSCCSYCCRNSCMHLLKFHFIYCFGSYSITVK